MPDAVSISEAEKGQLEGVIESLFQTLKFDIKVESETGPDSLYFNFQGADHKRLQDHRGETARALGTLLQEYWNRHFPEKKVQIRCDVDHESQRQERQLREQALAAAETLKGPNDTAEIGPFNSYERRIIHLSLQENQAIETQSVGDGHQKRVKLTWVGKPESAADATESEEA